MSGCDAILTTATVEPCDCVNDYEHAAMYGPQFREHVTLHEIGCPDGHPRHIYNHYSNRHDVKWTDSTPGATPHTVPMVSDVEFSEALAAMQEHVAGDVSRPALMAALEAAARTRQGDGL